MNNGYVEVLCPNNKRANKSTGLVYEHVLVAEELLGRSLKSGECVHHLDMNRSNNDPSNIIVFKTSGDHSKYHKLNGSGIIMKTPDGSYVCYNKNINIRDNSKYHSGSNFRIFNFCTTDDLTYSLLRLPFTVVAASLGISDIMLVKICKNSNIPYKSSYYRNESRRLGISFCLNKSLYKKESSIKNKKIVVKLD